MITRLLTLSHSSIVYPDREDVIALNLEWNDTSLSAHQPPILYKNFYVTHTFTYTTRTYPTIIPVKSHHQTFKHHSDSSLIISQLLWLTLKPETQTLWF